MRPSSVTGRPGCRPKPKSPKPTSTHLHDPQPEYSGGLRVRAGSFFDWCAAHGLEFTTV